MNPHVRVSIPRRQPRPLGAAFWLHNETEDARSARVASAAAAAQHREVLCHVTGGTVAAAAGASHNLREVLDALPLTAAATPHEHRVQAKLTAALARAEADEDARRRKAVLAARVAATPAADTLTAAAGARPAGATPPTASRARSESLGAVLAQGAADPRHEPGKPRSVMFHSADGGAVIATVFVPAADTPGGRL